MADPVNGRTGLWLRAAKDIGVPAVLAIIVLTQLAPPIYEGVSIAREAKTLMQVQVTTGVMCRGLSSVAGLVTRPEHPAPGAPARQ